MADAWRHATLGEFVSLQRGHDLPDSVRRPGRIPVLGSFGVTGWHNKAKAPGPGVTIGRSGASFGVVSYTAEGYWPLNTALYVTDFHGNDPKFAYYFLKALDFSRFNSGSAQPSLNRNYIYPIPVNIPPRSEQHAIAHILGTLDDKIELNQRMNETLEAMAKALFKSWFVDFAPVRAKFEGRDLDLPKSIADQFPDGFEESELGEIPRGWHIGKLGDVAEHLKRALRPDEMNAELPYIGLEHMPRRSIALTEWGDADGLGSNKYQFRTGEILFGKLRPYFHKVGVAPVDGVCSTDIVVLAPKADIWFGFVLSHVSSDAFVEFANGGSTGTKMPRTSWSEMGRYPLAVPPGTLTDGFNKLIKPAVDRIISSVHEVRALAALRDTLLPKLISGELRVEDAARFLGGR